MPLLSGGVFDGRWQLAGALASIAGAYLVFGRLCAGLFLLAAGLFTLFDQIPWRPRRRMER